MPTSPGLIRRITGVFLSAVIATPIILSALSTPAHAAVVPLFPNLKTLPPRELRFDRADITADLSGVYDNVLRFSNDTYNAGDGPLILNGKIDPTTLSGPSTQRVMNSDGTYTDYPLHNDIYWHAAHHHYHFDHWGDYQLWTKSAFDTWMASGRTVGAPLYDGAKTTSCVTDEEFIVSAPNAVYPGPYGLGGCQTDGQGNIHMGLSVGWGDTYDWYRQLQWIDMGQNTLGNGTYVLYAVADPLNIVYESASKADQSRESVDDNSASTTFVVSNGSILDSDAPTGTVSINHVDPSTTTANVSVDVVGRDDVSEPNQMRLSNDGSTWKTFSYTSSGSTPTTVSWNLTDATAGGNSASGIKTVYAQVHDNSGKWGSTFTDTIDYEPSGPPPPPPPTGPYAQTVKGDNPAAYWRLDETSGTTANDSAGSNPGTYKGGVSLGKPSLLNGDSDTAASFSGSGQSVGVVSTGPISPAGSVSVEAWIKPTALPAAGAYASIVTKPESYSLQFNGPKLEFTIMLGGTRERLQAPTGAIALGVGYQVAGTFDGTTQRLYINGVQVASASQSPGISVNTNALNIGSWNGSSEYFNGIVDEVSVYPVALSAAQIGTHYTAGVNPPAQGQSQLSISRSGTGSGSVTSSPSGISCGASCSAPFTTGTSVTLTATAAAGSAFTGWTGGGCSGTGTCTLTLNSNQNINAAFTTAATSTLSVTTSGTGSGSVTSSPSGINCGATCSAPFTTGSSVTLTATPAAGSAFTGWTGGGCSGTGTCTLTVNSSTSVNAAFTTASGTTYAQAVAGDAPAGYWRLDETSGTTAADSAGTNPGTYSGATLGAAGLLASATDKAATFSGSNQSVKVTSSTALSPTGSMSVEAWIKPAAIPAAGAYASVATKAESYSLQFNGPKLEFTIMQSGTRRRLQAPSGAVAVGGTYHVVGTYDGTTQRLYINGAQVASAALTGAITANTNNFYIGSWNGSSEFFKGTVDEVAVYPTALSAARVSTHYTTGITSLVAMVRGAAATGQLVSFNTNDGSGSVSVGGTTPVAVAFDNGLHRAYVSRNRGRGTAATNGVTVFDSRTWRVLANVTTSHSSGPSAIAVDPVTHLVYVTAAIYAPFEVRGSVTVINGRTDKVVRSIATGPGPKAIAVNAKTHRVYVTEQTGTDGDLAIAVIDARSSKVIATVPIGPYGQYYNNPFGLAINTTTNTVYASNPLNGIVYTFDGNTNAIVGQVAVGSEPGAVAVNARTDTVYVTGARTVAVIDGRSGRITHRVSTGAGTRGITVDVARNKVYATTNGGGFVTIDGRTLHSARTHLSGLKPNGIAVDPATGGVVVANGFNANVSKYADHPAVGTS